MRVLWDNGHTNVYEVDEQRSTLLFAQPAQDASTNAFLQRCLRAFAAIVRRLLPTEPVRGLPRALSLYPVVLLSG